MGFDENAATSQMDTLARERESFAQVVEKLRGEGVPQWRIDYLQAIASIIQNDFRKAAQTYFLEGGEVTENDQRDTEETKLSVIDSLLVDADEKETKDELVQGKEKRNPLSELEGKDKLKLLRYRISSIIKLATRGIAHPIRTYRSLESDYIANDKTGLPILQKLETDKFLNTLKIRKTIDFIDEHKIDFDTLLRRVQRLGLDQFGGTVSWLLGNIQETAADMEAQDVFLTIAKLSDEQMSSIDVFFHKYTFLGTEFLSTRHIARISQSIDFIVKNPILSPEQTQVLDKIQKIHDVLMLPQFESYGQIVFLPDDLFATRNLDEIVSDPQTINEQYRLIEILLERELSDNDQHHIISSMRDEIHNLKRIESNVRKKIIALLNRGIKPNNVLIMYLRDTDEWHLTKNGYNEGQQEIDFASRLCEMVDTNPELAEYTTSVARVLGKEESFLLQLDNQKLALLALRDQSRTKFMIAQTTKLAEKFQNDSAGVKGDLSKLLVLTSDDKSDSQLLKLNLESILGAVQRNEITDPELGLYFKQILTIRESFNTKTLQPIHVQMLEFLILHHSVSPSYLENGRISNRFILHFPDFTTLLGVKPQAPDFISLISTFTRETCPQAYEQLFDFFEGSSASALSAVLRETISGDEFVSESFIQFWSVEKTLLEKVCFFLDKGGAPIKYIAPHLRELQAANAGSDLFWNFVFAENNLYTLEPEIQFLYSKRSAIDAYLTPNGFTSQFYLDFYVYTRDGNKGARIADKSQLELFGELGDEEDRKRDEAILSHLSLHDARFWSVAARSYKYANTDGVDFLVSHKNEIQMTYDGEGLATQVTMVFLARENVLEAQEAHASRSLSPGLSPDERLFWNTWLPLSKPAKRHFNAELVSREGIVDASLLSSVQKLKQLLNERVPGRAVIVRDLADFESILDAEGGFNDLNLARVLHQKGEREATKDVIARSSRDDWRAFLGTDLFTRFLRCLPVQTDEARNAFTHNGYDRVSELIEFLTQQCPSDFALDHQHISTLIDYISHFGLSRSVFAIHYFFSLRRAELGKLAEMPQDIAQSGIKTTAEMITRIDTLNSRLYSADPILPEDLQELSRFDAAMLGVATGRDRHRFMNRRSIDQLLADFVADYETGKIAQLNEAFEPMHIEVQKSQIIFDYASVAPQYEELKSEILSSLSETDSAEPEKSTLARLFSAKRSELVGIAAKTEDQKKKYIVEQIDRLDTNVHGFSEISDSEGLLTFIANYKWSNAERSVANGVFRRLLFKQLLRSHHSPQYLQDLNSALLGEPSFTAVNYMVNFVNDLVKHHLLNTKEENREKYWSANFFKSMNQGKMKDFIGGLFASAGDLQRTVAKSESVALAQTEEVDMIPDRGLIGELSGYLADVCYTGVEHLLAEWPVTPYKFIQKQRDEQGKTIETFIGSVLVFQVQDKNNNPCLLVRAFNIPDEEKHPTRELIASFVDKLKVVGEKIGAKRILAAGTSGTISNYPIATSYFQTAFGGEDRKVELAEPFLFNGYDITDKCILVAEI